MPNQVSFGSLKLPSLHCSSNVNSAFKAFAGFECMPCVHQVTSLGPVLKIFYFLIKILSICTQVGVFLGLINFVKSLYACLPLQSLQYFLAFWGISFSDFWPEIWGFSYPGQNGCPLLHPHRGTNDGVSKYSGDNGKPTTGLVLLWIVVFFTNPLATTLQSPDRFLVYSVQVLKLNSVEETARSLFTPSYPEPETFA